MSEEDYPKTNGDDLNRWSKQTQRTIDFILQQQAQFTADMQQMREAQAEADRRWDQRWGRTEESIRALLSIAEIHQQEISSLGEAQAETDRQMRETAERFKETGERFKETDEKLNALIDTVERIISERRNGGGQATEGDGPQGEGQR
jgi:hypothetical protein